MVKYLQENSLKSRINEIGSIINAAYFLLLLCLPYSSLKGQKYFSQKHQHLDYISRGNLIQPVEDGFIVLGCGTDENPYNPYLHFFAKHDFSGNLQFVKRYDYEPGYYYFYDLSDNVLVKDDKIYAVLQSHPFRNKILIYDLSGNILKSRKLINLIQPDNFYGASTIGNMRDDNIYFGATITYVSEEINNFKQAAQITILNDSLDMIRQFVITTDSFQYQQLHDLKFDGQYFYMTGILRDSGSRDEEFQSRITICKIDTQGQIIWRYISPKDNFESNSREALLTEDNKIVITYMSGRRQKEGRNYYYETRPAVAQFDINGKLEWKKLIGLDKYNPNNFNSCIIESLDRDGYVMAGEQANWNRNEPLIGDTLVNGDFKVYNGFITKVSSTGNIEWQRYYRLTDTIAAHNNLMNIAYHPYGGYILAGRSTVGISTNENDPISYTWLLHVDENGCLIPGCDNVSIATEDHITILPFTISPNPAQEYIVVYLENKLEKCACDIYDIGGKKIISGININITSENRINIQNLLPSNYILGCRSESGKIGSAMFVKQ